MRILLALVIPSFLLGCAGSGPRTDAIFEADEAVVSRSVNATPFAVIPVDTQAAKLASNWLDKSEAQSFIRDTGSTPVIIGPSDILEISIVSTNENGFIDFNTSSLSQISTTSFPAQEVASDGKVSVPPIGRIKAQGHTTQSFENHLEEKLRDKLLRPSVIVRMTERHSARVSVLGAVLNPGTYSIDLSNTKLVEILAEAGGPDGRAEHLELSFSRRNHTRRAPLDQVYENSKLNIHVRHGDVISLDTPARRLPVLGAGGINTTLVFDEPDLNLAEALGRAGGLLNRRADKKGVFVYREISANAARALQIDVAPFKQGTVPAIFNIDLTTPQSLFAAKDFKMGPDDLIYISDSANEEIAAVFSVFTNFAPTPAEYVRDATIN